MAVNYGLLEPVNIAGNMMAGQQQAQQNQLAQQQLLSNKQQMETGALQQQQTQLQVDQLKRDRDALATLQQQFVANGKSPNLEENFGAMIQSGIPHFVDIGTQGLQKIQQQKQFANIIGGGTAAPAAQVAPNALGGGAYDVNAPVQPTNALAPAAAPAASMGNVQAQISAAYQLGTPAALAWAKAQEDRMKPVTGAAGGFVYNPQTQSFMQAPEKTAAPVKNIANINPSDFTSASLQKFNTSNNYADLVAKPVDRSPAQPQPPVAVVDPATGKQVYVTREQALSGRMTPASAMEGLSPKDIQTREAKYPQAKQATTTVSATMNEIDATIQRLLANEKGLNGITGLVYGNTMALTDAARKAQADLKQLKNLAFVQGLTELRNASSTGAGVGNVSNKEGDRFENLKASLEQSQSTQDLKDSLTRLKSQANATSETIKQAFEDTYSYRNNVAAPSAGAGEWKVVK
jgi:hypothetical protein